MIGRASALLYTSDRKGNCFTLLMLRCIFTAALLLFYYCTKVLQCAGLGAKFIPHSAALNTRDVGAEGVFVCVSLFLFLARARSLSVMMSTHTHTLCNLSLKTLHLHNRQIIGKSQKCSTKKRKRGEGEIL